MNNIQKIVTFLALCVLFSCKTDQGEMMIIDGKTTLFVGADEPEALKRAVEDLAVDLEKVFGIPYTVTHKLADCTPTTIVVALNANIPNGLERPEGWEKLLIKGVPHPFEDAPIEQALVLTGSDKRGAIYAVYEFAERFLGVDPLYWWTDNEPEQKTNLQLASDVEVSSNAPTIRYRGLFINDEDLLSGWKSGTWRLSGISPEAWDRLFEAILRMKGNMITPGTFIFPYEPQIKAAGRRGLIITQHHIEVLGLNTFRWPEDVPYSFGTNKEKLISAWTKSVEQYPKDLEILWTVGYRGLHDRAFWDDDKDSPASKQGRADLIKEAILTQMDIVKARYKNPYFIMNTWGEGIEFVREGYLELPEEVNLVWADKGWGLIRDGGTISEGQGVYYHTAMFNQRCNQLSEMVPIDRIQKEIGRAVKAGAREYLLVNCSDFRPVVMSTKAALSLAWDATPWLKDSTHHQNFLEQWATQQFGAELSDRVVDIYNRYTATPVQYSDKAHEKFGDNYYHLLSRGFLRKIVADKEGVEPQRHNKDESYLDQAEQWIALCEKGQEPWKQLLKDAENLMSNIPESRKGFYQAHVLNPIIIHHHSNTILMNIARASLSEDANIQTGFIDAALAEIPNILAAFKKAEYGKWKDFYLNDLMTGITSTRKSLEIARKVVNGETNYESISQYSHGWDMWEMVKGYQGKQRTPM